MKKKSNIEDIQNSKNNLPPVLLKHEIRTYSTNSKTWKKIGFQINGQILDLVFCNNQIYLSVFLPHENFPHQLVKLNGNKWEKVAQFNGNIISIQALQNKLYVLGNFKKVNDSINSNFVVVKENVIKPFRPVGLRTTFYDHMKSSETALFLTSNGGIYKFKNELYCAYK